MPNHKPLPNNNALCPSFPTELSIMLLLLSDGMLKVILYQLSCLSRGSLYNFSGRLTFVFLICHIGIAAALWQNYLYLAFHVQTWDAEKPDQAR